MNPNDMGLVMLDCGEHELALKHFEDSLAHDPEDTEALHMKAVALYGLGRYDEVLESCDKAIRTANVQSREDLDEAKRLRALGNDCEALDCELDAKICDRHASNMSHIMAKALFRLERAGEALAKLNSGIGLDEDDPEEYAILELILREICFKEDGGRVCQKLRFGRGATPFYGHAACAPGHKANLVNDLEQAIKAARLRLNDADAQAGLARILLRLSMPQRALGAIGKAVSLDPANAKHHVAKADILCDLGEMGRCAEAADDALEIEPDNLDARAWKGLCLYEDGNDIEGCPMVENAFSMDESNPTACLCHSYMLACEEDSDEARELCVSAMMDHPHDDRLRALLEAMLEDRANHP